MALTVTSFENLPSLSEKGDASDSSSETNMVEDVNVYEQEETSNASFEEEMIEDLDGNEDKTTKVADHEKEKVNATDASNKKIDFPKSGMSFDSIDILLDYYRDYGKQEGFPVSIRTSSKGINDCTRYVTLACSRNGQSKSTSKNLLKPHPIAKTKCGAKVNVVLKDDGKWYVSKVSLGHNHSLSPSKTLLHYSNRKIKPHVKRQLLLLSEAGIEMNQSMNALAVEAKGHENLSFIEKDARNFIGKERRLNLGDGDAEALQNYFTRVQATDSNFFFVMELDSEDRLKNLFWADARSRAAYEEFGDVITFDTTYLTNRYDMPFAPFVGVNHHGQSILLGCGLISSEDTETFIWLFKSWLACMSNRAPGAIITDQDRAMQNAIQCVFPNARHRWCLWHILKKLPEKFGGHKHYEAIRFSLHNCVYDSLFPSEFETNWKKLIEKYELQSNAWLIGLYEERRRWVPYFLKDCFWAGMSTTQRSESMNSFFDGYVNAKTTLKQFVEKYDHALRSKVRKEKEADANSFNSWVPCVTLYFMEKQVQAVYTTKKFKEFQEELTGKMYCDIGPLESCGALLNYEVSEDIWVGEDKMDRKNMRKVKFKVCLVKEESEGEYEVKCNCRLFEFRGILCRHAIAVLIKEGIHDISAKYILRRWRKDIKRCHIKVKVCYSDWTMSEEGQRYDKMCKNFFEAADLAYEFEGKCNLVNKRIDALKQELRETNDADQSCHLAPQSKSNRKTPKETQKILAPLVVHCKGRPPSKRKQSKVEQVATRKREKKNRIESEAKKLSNSRNKNSSLIKGSKLDNVVDVEQGKWTCSRNDQKYPSIDRDKVVDLVGTQRINSDGESQSQPINPAFYSGFHPASYGFVPLTNEVGVHPTFNMPTQPFLHQLPYNLTQHMQHLSQMQYQGQQNLQSWQGDSR